VAQAAVTPGLWLGAYVNEARAAYERARAVGLTSTRALVIGTIASFKDCWAFRAKIAAKVGCSVRTVQRAITQAREEGLIGVARAKRGECPPNWAKPVECGWSHRWTVGWGKAGEAVKLAIENARARWLVKHAVHLPAKAHPTLNVAEPAKTGPRWKTAPDGREWRSMRPEEIAAELDAALARMPPPPE
jgi:hypothetical protein